MIQRINPTYSRQWFNLKQNSETNLALVDEESLPVMKAQSVVLFTHRITICLYL